MAKCVTYLTGFRVCGDALYQVIDEEPIVKPSLIMLRYEQRKGKSLDKQVTLVLESNILQFWELPQFTQNGRTLKNGMTLADILHQWHQ